MMRENLDLERFPLDDLQGERAPRAGRTLPPGAGRSGPVQPDRPGSAAGTHANALPRWPPLFDGAAFSHRRSHNIYFEDEVPGLAADHPALQRFETANQTVCADQIPDSLLCQIYEWPPLRAFLAATMDKPELHLMADPLARTNVMAYRDGEALNWHFDRSEFTTTLLLQAPEAGGDFQYRCDLRSDRDPNYAGVARLLSGADTAVKTLPLTAGTLNVFKGRNTAHRVTPVIGARDRMIAVFSYYERPGVTFSTAERLGFYGRCGEPAT